jgi:hypothetical protein
VNCKFLKTIDTKPLAVRKLLDELIVWITGMDPCLGNPNPSRKLSKSILSSILLSISIPDQGVIS